MANESGASINLESLLKLSARLNDSIDEDFILNSALLSIMGKLKVVRACILMPDKSRCRFETVIQKGKSLDLSVDYCEPEAHNYNINDTPELSNLSQSGFFYCFPVYYQKKLLALICAGAKLDSSDISSEELYYSGIVTTITANALQNTQNHTSLVKAKNNLEIQNQLLSSLFEMSRDFSAILSKSEIIKMLSFRLMGQLMVSKYSILLINSDPIKHPISEDNTELVVNRLGRDFNAELFELLNSIISRGLNKTIYISHSSNIDETGHHIFAKFKVEVIAPMIIQSKIKGLLLVGRKLSGDEFSSENLQFIDAIGNRAIAALENDRLFKEEIEKKKLENELNFALEIQKNLLPKSVPELNGYELAGISIPSRTVGGDYFDFIPLNDTETLIAIADVSGKGMPAALIMANVQAALRVIGSLNLNLEELVHKLNKLVYDNTSADKFVTFFCGIINTTTNTFRYINAGHNPPMLLKNDNTITELTEGGLILGLSDVDLPYKHGSVKINTGEVLLLYTDGISEASSCLTDKDFGTESIEQHLRSTKTKTANHIMESLITKVKDFEGENNQYDDLTLVVLKSN